MAYSEMAYSDFTLAKAKEAFALTTEEQERLFDTVAEVQPSSILQQLLAENLLLATAINSEKARSEFLIAPVLLEIRRQLQFQVTLFSGTEFNVDPAQGLVGFCDFLLSASPEQYFISTPIVVVVEAKNENIVAGLGQCVATMVAAQRFNQRAGNDVPIIYGTVTTGSLWKFLVLDQATVRIDPLEYHVNQVNKVLGILLKPFQDYSLTSI